MNRRSSSLKESSLHTLYHLMTLLKHKRLAQLTYRCWVEEGKSGSMVGGLLCTSKNRSLISTDINPFIWWVYSLTPECEHPEIVMSIYSPLILGHLTNQDSPKIIRFHYNYRSHPSAFSSILRDSEFREYVICTTVCVYVLQLVIILVN